MPATPQSFVIDPQGVSVAVDIHDVLGGAVTVYSERDGSTPVSLPTTISASTEFFFASGGASRELSATPFVVSAKFSTVEVAGPNGTTAIVEAHNWQPETFVVNLANGGLELANLLDAAGGGGGGVSFDWAQVMGLTESPWDPAAGGFYANASDAPADGGWVSLKFSDAVADLTIGMLSGDDYIESSITDSSHQSAIDVYSSSGGSSAEWDMRAESLGGSVVETIRNGNRTAIHREAGSENVKETLTAAVGQTGPLLDLKDENGNHIFLVTPVDSGSGVDLVLASKNEVNGARFEFYASEDPDGDWYEGQFRVHVHGAQKIDFDVYDDAVTPANSYTTLTLRAYSEQTDPLLKLWGTTNNVIFAVTPTAVGFHDKAVTPVAQAAAPTTLGDVITILTDLGLCAA